MQLKINGSYSDIMQNSFGWHNPNRFRIMYKYDPYSNMYKNLDIMLQQTATNKITFFQVF